MNFTVGRQEALRAFRLAKAGVLVRCTLPILANVLVEADQATGQVALTGYNMESGLRLSIPAEVAESGATTITAWQIVDLLQTVTVGAVAFAADNGSAQVGPAKLGTLPAEEYPPLPTVAGKPCLTIPADKLAEGLARVAPFASKDITRATLQGVLLEVKGRRLILSATDSYRVARLPLTGDGQRGRKGKAQAIMPAKCAAQLAKMIGKAQGTAELRIADRQMTVTWESPVGRCCFTSRLIEGQFPACGRIWRGIRLCERAIVTIGNEVLRAEATAAYSFARSDAGKLLFALGNGAVKIRAFGLGDSKCQDATYESVLPAAVRRGRHHLDEEAEGRWHAVNGDYLLSVLKFLGAGDVRWRFGGDWSAKSPFTFTSPSRPGAIVAVMPMEV